MEPASIPASPVDPFDGVEDVFNEADIRATRRFLGHDGLGVTEVRIISPDHGISGIGFFDNEDAFVRTCVEASGKANVYVGIQPRPMRFLDQAPNRIARLRSGAHDQDIEAVTAIVLDIDPERPKDTASTEEELGKAIAQATELADWLESKGMVRPVRVMSGNGCHLWFAMPSLAVSDGSRAEIAERLKAFEARLRSRVTCPVVKLDSIYNLSRIIKVAGTLSVKGANTADRPHRLARPLDPFVRREDEILKRAILAMPVTLPPHPALALDDDQPIMPAAELTPLVRSLLLASSRLRATFEGRGKTAIGDDGRPLDTSSSGYDFSLVMALANKGVTDPQELATALWHRPDGAARAKGERYVARTVRRALDLIAAVKPKGSCQPVACALPDFEVTRMVVFDSNPPVYHMYVDGKLLVLSADDLVSEHRFKKKFVETLRRIPKLPRGDKKKDEPGFEDLINDWLQMAEVVHQPPEASRRGLLKDELRMIIDGLGEAENADDLERGKALRIDGRRAFKIRTLAKAARDSLLGDVGTHELGDVLRDMGCTSTTARVDGHTVRVWLAPEQWNEEAPEPPASHAGTDEDRQGAGEDDQPASQIPPLRARTAEIPITDDATSISPPTRCDV